MVAPGFLQAPDVARWLNGIEPAWTMLEFDSYCALGNEPSAENRAIRLVPDLTAAELSGAVTTRNALALLRRSAEAGGLKLTETGNLSRAVVKEILSTYEWPDHEKEDFFRFHKVINEPDFYPLHFVRMLTEVAKLTRKHNGRLISTRLGKNMLVLDQQRALQALLFHLTFWHVNLAYFDRFPLGSWPQSPGVVLWSLSASANDWLPPKTLARLCAVPVTGILESTWDLATSLMEIRVLRPLVGFGLLESRMDGKSHSGLVENRSYRKTPLFDRFLHFDIQIERPSTRH